MKKIFVLLFVLLVAAFPVLADINQNADLNGGTDGGNIKKSSDLAGGNLIVVNVDQEAWNYGTGDINQDIDISVTGNIQMLDQNDDMMIEDPGFDGEINNTIKGFNLIKINIDQYGKNIASGNISQGIEVEIEGNVQNLDQDVLVIV